IRQALQRMEPGVRVTTMGRLRSAIDALQGQPIGCIVTDLRLLDAEGLHIVRALRSARREPPVIVVTGVGSEELAVASLKLGAADYVTKHERYLEALPSLVREALGRSVLAAVDEPATDPTCPVPRLDSPFVGATRAMRAVLAFVDRAARSRVPVLVEGETGT